MVGLFNTLGEQRGGVVRTREPAAPREFSVSEDWQSVKFRLFSNVLERLEKSGQTDAAVISERLRAEVASTIDSVLAAEGMALNAVERARLALEVEHEIAGLGPLEPLLADPSIDDIVINGPFKIYVERGGKMGRISTRFRNNEHLMNIIQRIVGPIGRRVDEASPYVDARLPDGSRVNIVIPPIALDGATVSIRKFKPQTMTGADYIRAGSMTREMLDFLARAVRSRLNVLISGGTGTGKTTLLNMLSGYIGAHERLITVEDAAELRLRQDHVVRLETRPPSIEGTRAVDARDLVRNALRMRPDRIILGEVRGGEAVEMLQAMSTGHDGSMATMHANSARDAFARLELLLGFGGLTADPRAVRRYIANSVQILVQIRRMSNGKRRVESITELTGLEGDAYSLNRLFSFHENPPLSGEGEFKVDSTRPFYADKMAQVPPGGIQAVGEGG